MKYRKNTGNVINMILSGTKVSNVMGKLQTTLNKMDIDDSRYIEGDAILCELEKEYEKYDTYINYPDARYQNYMARNIEKLTIKKTINKYR